MEESLIYDLLASKLLRIWRDEAKEKDECGFMQIEKDTLQELAADLSEKNKELLNKYFMAVEDRIDVVYYDVSIKILNFGIKIGMQLQRSFLESGD